MGCSSSAPKEVAATPKDLKVPAGPEVTKTSFKYSATAPIPFEEGKKRGHWWGQPEIWDFEPAKDTRPEGPQVGDKRLVDKDFGPGIGQIKTSEVLDAIESNDKLYMHKYTMVESNFFVAKPFIGTLSVTKDKTNTDQCFYNYEASWESGELTELHVGMLKGAIDGMCVKEGPKPVVEEVKPV